MEDPHSPEQAPVEGRYANHFRVGYNAFEFLVDFAQESDDEMGFSIHTRIITMPAYAKVLSSVLAESIEQYEKKFGTIPNAV